MYYLCREYHIATLHRAIMNLLTSSWRNDVFIDFATLIRVEAGNIITPSHRLNECCIFVYWVMQIIYRYVIFFWIYML